MSDLRYTGINRQGEGVIGQCLDSPARFVEAKFKAGWRQLDVRDEDGIPVGAIDRNLDTNKRRWWAES